MEANANFSSSTWHNTTYHGQLNITYLISWYKITFNGLLNIHLILLWPSTIDAPISAILQIVGINNLTIVAGR